MKRPDRLQFSNHIAVRAIYVLAFLSLWTSLAEPQNLTLDQIIAGNETAVGGQQAIDEILIIRLSTTVTFGDPSTSGSMVLTMKRPNLMRVETSSQGGKVVSGFDGSTAWSIDPQTGIAAPLTLGQSASGSVSSFQVDSILGYLRSTVAGQTVETVGNDQVNGVNVYHIRATKADGSIFEYFIDQTTFLIAKASTQVQQSGTAQTVESYPADYRTVNGVTLPYSLEMRLAGQPAFKMQVQKVDINPVIDTSIFAMDPPPTAVPK